MFSGGKSSGHRRVPSPKMKDDHLEPLDTDFPAPNSLFPQYSNPHPGFSNATHAIDEETVDFVTSSDGIISPRYSRSTRVNSPEGDKQIPLHVQTFETMSEDEEEPPVKHPSEFPYLSPPQSRKKQLMPMHGGAQETKKNATTEKQSSTFAKHKIGILVCLLLGLLAALIVLIVRSTSPTPADNNAYIENTSSGSNLANDIAPDTQEPAAIDSAVPMSSNTSSPNGTSSTLITNNEPQEELNFLPPMNPTTPRPTPVPSVAPIVMAEPTLWEPITSLPSIPPKVSPTTRAPTIQVNHPLIRVIQPIVPRQILLDPYTPQGEALIWMATTDRQTPSNNNRIIQRFVMTVMDVALHSPRPRLWSSRNLHECRWPGVTCNDSKHVTGVNWARQSLQGTIPTEISLLTHLESVDIAQNQLKGSIEPLYSLEKLKYAYVFENQLTGTISPDIQNCRNLTRFFAGHNQLSGSIPADLKMRPLEWLVVHWNRLTGTIPSDLSLGLNVYLDLSHNQFTGTIPENFATEIVPNVRHVHLDHNQFTGSIPGTFRELGKGRLRQLFLNDNRFNGKFPEDWLFPKFLNNIDLSNNRFRNNLNEMCLMSVFEYGELVELRADCPICNCDRLCRTCRDNKDYKYEYDDDDWQFDDDGA